MPDTLLHAIADYVSSNIPAATIRWDYGFLCIKVGGMELFLENDYDILQVHCSSADTKVFLLHKEVDFDPLTYVEQMLRSATPLPLN